MNSKGRKGTKEIRDKCGGVWKKEGHQRRCRSARRSCCLKWRSSMSREGSVPKSRQSIFSPADMIVSATGETSSVPRYQRPKISFDSYQHTLDHSQSLFRTIRQIQASLGASLSAEAQSNSYAQTENEQ